MAKLGINIGSGSPVPDDQGSEVMASGSYGTEAEVVGERSRSPVEGCEGSDNVSSKC